MPFRFVSSGGNVADLAAVNLSASGTINPGIAVDFIRGSGGAVVGPSTNSSTTTMVFGVAKGPYVQGISGASTDVYLFDSTQIWEVDCANEATTAQVGLRHALSAARGYIHNTASDVTGATGVFLAIAMTGSTSGSGKLLGRFVSNVVPVGQNQTTFI